MLTGAQSARAPAAIILPAMSISCVLGAKASTIGRIWSGWMLHIRVNPKSRAALLAAAKRAVLSRYSVTTLCEGTLPHAWHAEAISSLARTTSGCVNCPWMPMASAGMAPPWAATKSIKPKLSDCTRGWAAISNARCTAAGDSISAGSVDRPAGDFDVLHRLHLGNHDVAQLLAGLARDGGDVLLESRMVHRMDTHRDARLVAGQ